MSDSGRPEFLRLIFPTLMGTTKCIETSYDALDEVVQNGAYFDGSSVHGCAPVNSSDLLLRPIVDLPMTLPYDREVAILPCAIHQPSGKHHALDPVYALVKTTDRARSQGVRLVAGCELEFFLVRSSGAGSILPYDHGRYLSGIPSDGGLGVRREAARSLNKMGVVTTTHHHEVAFGQQEIGLHHSAALTAAVDVMVAKYVIAEIAYAHGAVATFMPKPFAMYNGSGMHIHQSLWDTDSERNLFASDTPSRLSEMAVHYVNGLLEHASALAAIVAPTVNSYRRLVPGFEAPTRIAWGPANRTTMIRVPQFNGSEVKARIEYRCPDPSCSPFLSIAAILAAGLDGILRRLSHFEPTTEDLYHRQTESGTLPTTMPDAIKELLRNQTLADSLGEQLITRLSEMRMEEWRDYTSHAGDPCSPDVTVWEIERYLTPS